MEQGIRKFVNVAKSLQCCDILDLENKDLSMIHLLKTIEKN